MTAATHATRCCRTPAAISTLPSSAKTAPKLFGKRGVLEPLSGQNVASMKDYKPEWTSRCAGYAMPYLWGTMGIVYRSDMVKTAPTSWNDLMAPDPALKKHIAMYDDHNEAFIAPLIMLGKSINANDNETLKAAFEVMKKQAPFVLTYDYVITSIQSPENGKNIYMALAYSGDQHVLNEKAGTPGVLALCGAEGRHALLARLHGRHRRLAAQGSGPAAGGFHRLAAKCGR